MGVWGQISGMLILWGGGGRQRLGMFIFSEGWFRVGGLGSDIGYVNVGGGGGGQRPGSFGTDFGDVAL